MAPPRRGTKRARSKSPEPEADASNSTPFPVDTPVPPPTTLVHVSRPEDSRWGHPKPPYTRGKDCKRKCCARITPSWVCGNLTKRAIPPAMLMMMKDVQHIQCYPELQNAFKGSRMNFKLYMIHQVPPTIMAMSRDWDLTFAHPFLKRLCHELEVEVVCGKGSGREDDADLVLSLTGSTWTKGSTLEPIPICPVFVRSGTHQDTTNRVKKWLADHFTCLEQNKFVYQDYECPVPYFVLESSWWTVGVGVKGRRGLELYEECLRSIKWDAGVQRVTLVLGYIIGSTAEYYREWYREHGPDRQTLEEG